LQNLRDSGVTEILIGNRDDAYKDAAIADGFQVVSIAEAAAWGDVVFLLIPDEMQIHTDDLSSTLVGHKCIDCNTTTTKYAYCIDGLSFDPSNHRTVFK
jgi:ketol-acid reductoisomerase